MRSASGPTRLVRARATATVVATLLAIGPAVAQPASAGSPTQARLRLAASALGELSAFRTIAADTLGLVRKGDLKAARARAKDLESAWDRAEAGLKPRDAAAWKAIDGRIDQALTEIRVPNPMQAACEASLGALLAQFDAAGRA